MSFYNEVAKLFDITESKTEYVFYTVTNLGVVVQGYKKILSFTTSQVVLLLKNGNTLILKGAKFVIKKLEFGEIVISGDMLSLEVEKQGSAV